MLLARRLVAAWLVRLGYALGGRVRRLSGSNVRLAQPLLRRIAYSPPRWALSLRPPAGKIVLGHLPTPLMPWACPELAELGISWVIKRDDMTGMELSGNKVRKLEFLMRDAVDKGCDCVITIGGIQSNHCRATAAAARLVGLEPHLVLRCSATVVDSDPGLVGNLLLDRMLGAKLHLVTTGEYATRGQAALTAALADKLARQGRTPYIIPVGGSNALGTWGYLDAMEELRLQLLEESSRLGSVDHIVFACGSGGTAAGIALGARLARLPQRLHAVGVCDSPDAFYDQVDDIAHQMGADLQTLGNSREWLTIYQGRGAGYAKSTDDELSMAAIVSAESGVLLDPVYSGKALYHFCAAVREQPDAFRGSRVLFWHTGGQLSMFEKVDQLAPMLPKGQVHRLKVPIPEKLEQ